MIVALQNNTADAAEAAVVFAVLSPTKRRLSMPQELLLLVLLIQQHSWPQAQSDLYAESRSRARSTNFVGVIQPSIG